MVRIQTVTLDQKVHPLGFKVVTADLKSLGLRNNPNILQYSVGEWFRLPKDQVQTETVTGAAFGLLEHCLEQQNYKHT